MASTSMWDMSEIAVEIIRQLPLVIQTAFMLASISLIFSGAGKAIILQGAFKGLWQGAISGALPGGGFIPWG
ncbi:MAG TPA: hypothetical protein ENN60_02140 [archaeon]|nr:hypothetical protein [archaeon]